MTGRIERIVMKDGREQPYTFIKGDDKDEYFLHRSAMEDDEWFEMAGLVTAGNKVRVQFDRVEALKGPRAANCKLIEE